MEAWNPLSTIFKLENQESQSYNSQRPENLGNWWYNSQSPYGGELGAASVRAGEHGHPKREKEFARLLPQKLWLITLVTFYLTEEIC